MIEIFRDPECLSLAAAELFAASAERAMAARGQFSVIVSGGETPRRTYELLSSEPFRKRIPWEKVHMFWADERCVAPSDPRSNFRMIRQALLDQVPLREERIHPIICGNSPDDAAGAYESTLRSHFLKKYASLDFVILGMGNDGHTASLFPGSPLMDEQTRWSAATQKPGEDILRVTLTPLLLNRAKKVVFLVAGPDKASMLQSVLEGPQIPALRPAQSIRPAEGKLLWYVEQSAASRLSMNNESLNRT